MDKKFNWPKLILELIKVVLLALAGGQAGYSMLQ